MKNSSQFPLFTLNQSLQIASAVGGDGGAARVQWAKLAAGFPPELDLARLLVAAVLAVSLTGCGASDDGSPETGYFGPGAGGAAVMPPPTPTGEPPVVPSNPTAPMMTTEVPPAAPPAEMPPFMPPAEMPPSDTFAPGITYRDDEVVFKTEQYELEPGEEKFICYATSLDEDVSVSSYRHEGLPTLHHLVFARTLAPEDDGMFECDVLFKLTWEPVYLAGAGSSSLEFPRDAAHKLTAGTQLLSQLHLLNASDKPATGALEVHMTRSTAPLAAPVNVYLFGNWNVSLPPQQASTVDATCALFEPIRLIAAFPHMHYLGTKLTFEVDRQGQGMRTVYERSPYDFDDQRMDPLELTLAPGDVTRTTCHYENTTDEVVTFGESTFDEMCFLVGFAVREGQGGCFVGIPQL